MDEPPRRELELAGPLVKLHSREDIAKFLRTLAESYQKQVEVYGDKLGSLFRSGPQETVKPDKKQDEKGKAVEKPKSASKGWVKLGPLLVNTSDPVGANGEVAYQIHEDLRQKLARTNDALKAFEVGSSAVVPEQATYFLYIRNGVPERVIVELPEKKKEVFSFTAKFELV